MTPILKESEIDPAAIPRSYVIGLKHTDRFAGDRRHWVTIDKAIKFDSATRATIAAVQTFDLAPDEFVIVELLGREVAL